MRRPVFTILCAISLLLCIAATALWVQVGDRKNTLALARINNPGESVLSFYLRLLVLLTPCWLVIAATLPLPLLWLMSYLLNLHQVTRIDSQGLCPACHYDLRATPHRCPECGAIPPAPIQI